MAGEAGSRSDEMLLELLLAFAIGRKDVKPIAQALIRTFGDLSKVLSASTDELARVNGIGKSSIVLLKVVNFIQSLAPPASLNSTPPKGAGPTQQTLFEDTPNRESTAMEDAGRQIGNKEEPTTQKPPIERAGKPDQILTSQKVRRKFQISNGYLLEFDQLARILNFLLENRDAKRINRKALQEGTGLPGRQIESLVSMGTAMGLIKPVVQILTPVGLINAEYDLFFEKHGTLEWCHYKGAGSYQNLIWFEVFNHLLVEETAINQEGWQEYFRGKFKAKYSDKTIKNHLPKEVRFVTDAYLEQNFSKIELLHRSPDERLYRSRYTGFNPLVLSAMIYDFCATRETQLIQIDEMAVTPGSPAMVFGLDVASLRQQIEGLHERGWLRYETTHNLDQIRLKSGYTAFQFLTAHFENREPRAGSEQSPGGPFE